MLRGLEKRVLDDRQVEPHGLGDQDLVPDVTPGRRLGLMTVKRDDDADSQRWPPLADEERRCGPYDRPLNHR